MQFDCIIELAPRLAQKEALGCEGCLEASREGYLSPFKLYL